MDALDAPGWVWLVFGALLYIIAFVVGRYYERYHPKNVRRK